MFINNIKKGGYIYNSKKKTLTSPLNNFKKKTLTLKTSKTLKPLIKSKIRKKKKYHKNKITDYINKNTRRIKLYKNRYNKYRRYNKSYKKFYKGGSGSASSFFIDNIIPAEILNLGREVLYNISSTYNTYNGDKLPVNPLPYKDQMYHIRKI